MNKKNEYFEQWLKDAADDSGKKIQSSEVFTGILTENFLNNPLCALQMGYAVLMDKPIILIVDEKTPIPKSLAKLAKVIERINIDNPKDMERAQNSIRNFLNAMQVEP